MQPIRLILAAVLNSALLVSCSKTGKEAPGNEPLSRHAADSIRLMRHMDSLRTNELVPIDLSEFKHKKLFGLSFERHPVVVGGGAADREQAQPLFDLVDRNFKARWALLAKRPGFFVIRTDDGFLATLTYDLDKIAAIRGEYTDPGANFRRTFSRRLSVRPDLRIRLYHEYIWQTSEGEYDMKTSTMDLYIDPAGKIKDKI